MNDFNSAGTKLIWKIAFEKKWGEMVSELVFCDLWSKQSFAKWH